MLANADTFEDAEFVAIPPSGTPHAVSDTPLTDFPQDGSTYGLLTTGDAGLADDPDDSGSSGVNNNGPSVRGNSDFDVSILRIDMSPQFYTNCLRLDFRFLSEEFPEYVDSDFNDAFVAELNQSTWTTQDSTIDAPDNFAFDSNGDVVSVNTTGREAMTEGEAEGVTYDGSTSTWTASTPIEVGDNNGDLPGVHSIYLSIFDQGDHVYDSAVFADNLRFGVTAESGGCSPGTEGPPPHDEPVLGTFPLRGTRPGVNEGLTPENAPMTSVFDHSMKDGDGTIRMYGCDYRVEAYTGEMGDQHGSGSAHMQYVDPQYFKHGCREGYAQDQEHSSFTVNGNYTGGSCTNCDEHLYYDGHPGIDYSASYETEAYAATSGTVRYPKRMRGVGKPYGTFHVLELVPDEFPEFRIYYLHLRTHPSCTPGCARGDVDERQPEGCKGMERLPLEEGRQVEEGCVVALTGDAGSPGAPHLHFEVRRVVPKDEVTVGAAERFECIHDQSKACVPVDPYGWTGSGEDPYEAVSGVTNSRLWSSQGE